MSSFLRTGLGAGFGEVGGFGSSFACGGIFRGGAVAVAVGIDLDDVGVLDEPVDGGDGDGWIGKHLAPFTGRLALKS